MVTPEWSIIITVFKVKMLYRLLLRGKVIALWITYFYLVHNQEHSITKWKFIKSQTVCFEQNHKSNLKFVPWHFDNVILVQRVILLGGYIVHFINYFLLKVVFFTVKIFSDMDQKKKWWKFIYWKIYQSKYLKVTWNYPLVFSFYYQFQSSAPQT